jgi:hypothetical protein
MVYKKTFPVLQGRFFYFVQDEKLYGPKDHYRFDRDYNRILAPGAEANMTAFTVLSHCARTAFKPTKQSRV